MCLDNVPIRELTGIASTFGIRQDDCFEAGELRQKIEEKREVLKKQQKELYALRPFLISCIDDSGAGVIEAD